MHPEEGGPELAGEPCGCAWLWTRQRLRIRLRPKFRLGLGLGCGLRRGLGLAADRREGAQGSTLDQPGQSLAIT